MKLCRFQQKNEVHVGLVIDDSSVLDLTPAGVQQMQSLLESDDLITQLDQFSKQKLPRFSLDQIKLRAPVEQQEVWAAGVTYLRSKTARDAGIGFQRDGLRQGLRRRTAGTFFQSRRRQGRGHR